MQSNENNKLKTRSDLRSQFPVLNYQENGNQIVYLDNGATNCILTSGGEGSIFINKNQYIITPAFDIDVVDTTGCGDAFDAGIITSLIKGFDLEKSLLFATATSGLVATGLGSDAGIVDFDDTMEKMKTLKRK